MKTAVLGLLALIGTWGAAQAQDARAAADKAGGKAAEPQAEAASDAASLMRLCHIDVKGDLKDEWKRLPVAASSVTEHHFSAAGKSFDYTATAGTLIVRDDEDKPIASLGYVAYTRKGGKEGELRPVTFAFNGGPGSSSLWLHMGALGPKRVVLNDPNPVPAAPYRTVENQ
ncbi:MAG TPA: hypothetical protein VEC59_02340, partial [Steroidobacteraceae bacterium]|nr:hypothetical protein [Steroidobacteraceae bacterium]